MARILRKTCTGMVLALFAVGCGDEDLIFPGGQPGPAVELDVSSNFLLVRTGESVNVGAVLRDEAGNPTAEAPTISACDAGLASTADLGADDIWSARASVTGTGFGSTCVNIAGGGLEATVEVDVWPFFTISGPDTLLSGGSSDYALNYLAADGSPVTAPADFEAPPLIATDGFVAVTETGTANTFNVAALRAPGRFEVRAFGDLPVATPSKPVVIIPGIFSGTLSANTAAQGGQIDVTTTLTLDGDEFVTIGGVVASNWTCEAADAAFDGSGTSLSFLVPWSLPAGTYEVLINNQGPGQVAEAVPGSFTVTAGTPVENRQGFPGVNTPGASIEDKIKLTRTLAFPVVFDPNVTGSTTTYYTFDNTGCPSGNACEKVLRLGLTWLGGAAAEDFDIQIIDGAFTAFLDLDGATLGHPESTLFNMDNGGFFFIRYQTFSGDGASHATIQWLGDGSLCADLAACTIGGEVGPEKGDWGSKEPVSLSLE